MTALFDIHSDDVLKMRTKEDTRKRKLFAELKQQMEDNVQVSYTH